ncbi:hypothetical protein KQH61_06030 [bacterium]|nr:hypothetical protein [bacterium]
MLASIYNLFTLILAGDFNGPLFGLFKDAPILQPIYTIHQTQNLHYIILLALVLIVMLPAIRRSFTR